MGKLIRPAIAFARRTNVLPDERLLGAMKFGGVARLNLTKNSFILPA
jgi:hypothetical protein